MKLTKNKKDNIIISSAIGALVIINIMLPTAGDFTYVAGAIGIVVAIGVWFYQTNQIINKSNSLNLEGNEEITRTPESWY